MKVRRLIISAELFFNLFLSGEHKQGYSVIQNAVPQDAKLVNVRLGWPRSIELLVESESFSEVRDGEEIPTLVPVIQTLAA